MDTIYSINGPVVKVKNSRTFSMQEMVYVGKKRLIGEVIRVTEEFTTIQVYECTPGLMPGESVEGTGSAMSATLGPGILDNIFDGIQRPLKKLEELSGAFIADGANVPSVDTQKKYSCTITVNVGDRLSAGDIYCTCPETQLITHKCMLSPLSKGGEVIWRAPDGEYKVNDTVVKIKTDSGEQQELTLCQKWPIRTPRPCKQRLPGTRPLITGQRIIDTVLPIAKGGTAAIPGGFGTGKTMTQHQLAKWCDADIIVYIGCGERGNEMTQVLEEFSELIDPHTQRPLTDRTVLIANTSNMPVASREASVYTSMTIAEYYRSMGLRVMLMADSTSRWAQALREMSNRMEELPGQDAFPMDLSAIIGAFYARAGYVYLNNGKTGSVTFLGTVSPAGGNLKEPVTEGTKKVARCFYALEQNRADKKRYPAVNPIDSYSKYLDYPEFQEYISQLIDDEWIPMVNDMKTYLQRGKEIQEQINILGDDGVPVNYHEEFWKSEVIDFVILQQDAFDAIDAVCPLERQQYMLRLVMNICRHDYDFDSFLDVIDYFKRVINLCKQMNYSEFHSQQFEDYQKKLNDLLAEKQINA